MRGEGVEMWCGTRGGDGEVPSMMASDLLDQYELSCKLVNVHSGASEGA